MTTDAVTYGRSLLEWDWLDADGWTRLHHAELSGEQLAELGDWSSVNVEGPSDEQFRLTCGRLVYHAVVPGVFTRMGQLRCERCCDALGYPRGKGSPKNDDTCSPLVEARLREVAP